MHLKLRILRAIYCKHTDDNKSQCFHTIIFPSGEGQQDGNNNGDNNLDPIFISGEDQRDGNNNGDLYNCYNNLYHILSSGEDQRDECREDKNTSANLIFPSGSAI